MAINRYYRGRVYEGELYTPPVEFVSKALEAAQKQYDTNYLFSEKIRDNYIQALPQDRARANEIQKQFADRVDQIVASKNGDYSQINKDLLSLQREMKSVFNPGGEGAAIQNNFNLAQESLKRERERLAKGEVDASQVALLENYYQKQKTNFNPLTKAYSGISPIDLPKTVDINKNFEEYFAKIKPRTIETHLPTGRKTLDGYHEFQTVKQSYIDPKEVSDGFASMLVHDIQYQDYINVLSRLSGIDPEKATNDIIQHYSQNVIPGRSGVFENSNKLDYKEDWVAKENLDFAHQKALENIKQQNRVALKMFDNEEMLGGVVPAELTVAKSLDKQYAPLPLEARFGDPGEYPFE